MATIAAPERQALPANDAPIRLRPARRARLSVSRGGARQSELELSDGEEWVVGRSPACDLPLDDPSLARKHAQLAMHRGRLTVRDLGSAEGTHVNGERISLAVLQPCDEVRLGATTLRVTACDCEDRPQAGAA